MPIQKCPLCLKHKQIVPSHLMPAAMYRYCAPPDRHPISSSSKFAIEPDRQLEDYLLCEDCENDLNQSGESWLVPLLPPDKRSFPFYDLLTKFPPEAINEDAVVYAAATNPELRSEELIHFAMGVFWKAAVHSWSPSRAEPLINLGSYADRIRKFLRYEAGFSEHLALMVGVLPTPAQLISFYNPYQGSKKEWHNFLFYVSGIEFCLAVGKTVHANARKMCFSHNPAHPIAVADFSADLATVLSSVWANDRRAKSMGK
jgi:hypothetical protein